jgi:ureidoacrylate peracid hydrolase
MKKNELTGNSPQVNIAEGVYHATKPLVEPSRVALLVVDVQNDYCHPDGVFMRNGVVCQAFPKIVEPLKRLMEEAKLAEVPIISTRQIIRANPEGYAVDCFLYMKIRPFLAREGFRPDTWGARLIDGLPTPDYDVEKQRMSGFYNTHLEALLRRLGTETLLLTGAYTNMCVETTARDAWCRDFRIVLVPDCCAAFDRELHRATIMNISALGNVLSSEELIRIWQSKTGT